MLSNSILEPGAPENEKSLSKEILVNRSKLPKYDLLKSFEKHAIIEKHVFLH